MMTKIFRQLCVFATLMLAAVHVVLAIDKTGWNNKERAAWLEAEDFLSLGHTVLSPQYRHSFPMTVPISAGDAEEAWNYAKQASAGPVFKNYHRNSKKSIYVLTKIPNGNRLVEKWGLDADGIPKNAFLYWKVKKNEHKLLGVDVWAAGAPITQLHSVDDIMRELGQRVR